MSSPSVQRVAVHMLSMLESKPRDASGLRSLSFSLNGGISMLKAAGLPDKEVDQLRTIRGDIELTVAIVAETQDGQLHSEDVHVVDAATAELKRRLLRLSGEGSSALDDD